MASRLGPIEPGDRDKLVTVQQLTESTGTSGFPVETWTTLDQMWMAKRDVGGRERFQANQLAGPYDCRWEAAYREDMDPDLVDLPKTRRLVYQGRTYDVIAATQIGRRDGIELLTLAASRVA